MLKEKVKKIKEIKNLINSGLIIQVLTENTKDKMNLWVSPNNYINYRCFGQSAVKNTIKDLTWLINNILPAKGQNIDYRIVKTTID